MRENEFNLSDLQIKKLQKDKEKLTTKAKGIGTKIKSLRAKTAK